MSSDVRACERNPATPRAMSAGLWPPSVSVSSSIGPAASSHPVAEAARSSALCARFAAWYSASASGESTAPRHGMVGHELLRGLDAEPQRQHRAEPGDLHRAESRECSDPLSQVGGIARFGPHALGLPVVLVGDDGTQILHAPRHRAREAVDRGALAKCRLELGRVHRRDPFRVEPADAFLELERSCERGRNRHLLVEGEPDEQCEWLAREELRSPRRTPSGRARTARSECRPRRQLPVPLSS